MRWILIGLLSFVQFQTAFAQLAPPHRVNFNDPQDPYYQIDSVEQSTLEVKTEALTPQKLEAAREAFQAQQSKFEAFSPAVNPYLIAKLLMYAWDLVVASKPVANVESKHVSALPEMANYHWTRLTGWKPERSVVQKLTISNLWKMKTIEATYGVKLLFGGGVKGRGQYIASARVVPSQVKVLPGYDFDLGVEVLSVNNVGAEYDPNAQVMLQLNFRVQSRLGSLVVKKSEWKERYLLQGDGFFRNQDTAEVYFEAVDHIPAPPLPSPSPTPIGSDDQDPLMGGELPPIDEPAPVLTPTPTPNPKAGGKTPVAKPNKPSAKPASKPTATQKPAPTPTPAKKTTSKTKPQ